MANQDSTCIYCREKRSFSREHVLQASFGRFRNALVLHNTVCSDCNQAFGETIDLIFARESAEGLDRYRLGIKPLAEIEKFRYSHVSLRAVNAGEYSDAQHRLFAVPGSTDVGAEIVPGAAIREREGNGFVQFTESEILEGIWSQNTNVDWS
jgi:hypothetical protein